jgi:Uma2 family endonuclease
VHGSVEMRVARHIDEYVTQHDLGVVFGSSTGIDLPSGDTLQPDCSFVSHQRLLDQPRAPTKLFLKVVPNLIVEILSDSTAQRDRTEKKALYEQNGVDEYWLVDPVRRRITVFALSANGYGSGVTYASGDVCSQVLAGLRIPLAEVFRLLDAAPRR